MQTINGKKMKELIDNRRAKAIDVDPAGEFKKAHIRGAINIPYNDKNFVQKVEKKFTSKDEGIVLCGKSQFSPQIDKLANALENAGYKNVYEYKAGLRDWKSSELNIQRQRA